MPESVAFAAVGCWELSWGVNDDPTSSAGSGELPDSVALEDSPLFGSEERLVSPATHPSGRGFEDSPDEKRTWEERYRNNRWWTDGARIGVRFSQGDTVSWTLTLEPVESELAGTAVYRLSAGPDAASLRARVRGREIDCPPG